MVEFRKIGPKEASRITEEYTEALMGDKYSDAERIEKTYEKTDLWGALVKIKNDIDDMLIA